MSLDLHLRLAGASLILLALAHAFFPRRFDWKRDLAQLTLLNRQIFLVHSFFIALMLVFFGMLSFVLAGNLESPTPLSRALLAGFCLFWATRLCVQLFVYDRQLWRGNAFNTTMHVLVTVFWTYLAAVYGAAFWLQRT